MKFMSTCHANFSSKKGKGYGGTIKRTAHTIGCLVGKKQKIFDVGKQLLPKNVPR